MRKLSFTQRLFLSNLVFAVPILVLMYLMYATATGNIVFGEQEMKGNRYQRPLERALRAVSFHKLMSRRQLAGYEKVEIEKWRQEADAAFADLRAIDAAIGTDLQFTPEGLRIRKREKFNAAVLEGAWNEMKAEGHGRNAEKVLAAHTDLIVGLRTMITHMGDTSNLILDPDLDSYYLMDVSLLALPQTQDRLQDIAATIEPLLERGTLTAEDRNRLVVMAAMLKEADVSRILASAETSMNEDGNFFGESATLKTRLNPALASYKEANERLIAMISMLAEPDTGLIPATVFARDVDAALAESHRLWSTAVDELDNLIQIRLQTLRAERSRNLILAGLAFLAACVFSAYAGWTLKASVTSILQMVKRLRALANGTSDAGTVLVSSSQKVSAAASQQASAITQTVATVNEIGAMVEKSVESVNRSAEVARASNDVANEGKQAVEQMVLAVDDIKRGNSDIMEQIERSNERFSEIASVIGDISVKTQVINEIVFQTKLLSFNASVEAARAGEQGKGFAVVAAEIGELARMSGSASDEISTMLGSSIQHVQAIVDETRKTVETLAKTARGKVETGTQVARRCGEVLEQVVHNVGEVSRMMGEIAMAQREQSQGVSQISQAMQELDSTTMVNSDSATETASSAERLAGHAEELKQIIFNLEGELLGRRPDVVIETITPKANVIDMNSRRKEPAVAVGKQSKSDIPAEADVRFKDF